MLSTLFEHEVYLGFPDSSPLQTHTFEQSFFGGKPIFLRKPHPSLLQCTLCIKEKLTFVCQVFCPLQIPQAYNRVLYVLYCEKCERVFRCIKQQSSKEEPLQVVQGHLRVVSESSFEIESSAFEVKELLRISKKARIEVEEETIDELQDQDDDDDMEEVKELDLKDIEAMGYNPFTEEEQSQSELTKEQLESLKHAAETREKQSERDQTFEEYKKVMKELDGPVLLYSNIPIPYNSQPINPQHFCRHCNSKLSLELQLTQRLLSLNPKLLRLDWGSLMVFTCSSSCAQSEEECVVVQYEVDAVKDEEVNALRKRQKNKKRKEQKDKKSKSKGKSVSKEKVQIKKQTQIQKKEVKQPPPKEEEGDWD